MKVGNNKLGTTPTTVDSAKTRRTDSTPAQAGKSGSLNEAAKKSSANVHLSERAQMMQKAKEIASRETVNEARVAELQKLIDAGKYRVDAEKIADRLVDEHLAIPD